MDPKHLNTGGSYQFPGAVTLSHKLAGVQNQLRIHGDLGRVYVAPAGIGLDGAAVERGERKFGRDEHRVAQDERHDGKHADKGGGDVHDHRNSHVSEDIRHIQM